MLWIRQATLLFGMGACAIACRAVLGIDDPSPTDVACIRDEHCPPGQWCDEGTCRASQPSDSSGGGGGRVGSSHGAGAGGEAPQGGAGEEPPGPFSLLDAGAGGNASEGGAGAGGASGTGTSSVVCDDGVTKCDDGWTFRCEGGEWAEHEPCAFGCSGDACAECAAAETRCVGNRFFTCTEEGTWDAGEQCAAVCSPELGCVEQCVPNERQCDGLVVLECDEKGELKPRSECPFVCRGGECTGECPPGERRCKGDTRLVCNDNGQYDSQPCEHGCKGGECLRCESGDGLCPIGCTYEKDGDCRHALGAPCTSNDECESGHCRDGVCCDSACTGECEACDLPGIEGTCTVIDLDTDVENCGVCGRACSTQNIEVECRGGKCDGECREGFLDCDGNKTKNGCEIDVRTDPAHCGACFNACEYPACEDGECPLEWGFPGAGTDVLHFDPNILAGTRIDVTKTGELLALGAVTTTPGVRLRLGIYTANDGLGTPPQDLIAQTGELVAVDGKTWGEVPRTVLEPGTYWIFFVADDLVGIEVSGSPTELWAWTTQNFDNASLPSVPAILAYPSYALGHVYAVLAH